MSGLVLALVAFAILGASSAHYFSTIRAVRVAKRPRANQVATAVAMGLALVALGRGAGWVGGALAIAVLAIGGLSLFLTLASGLPPGRITVSVGGPALDFEAPDAAGRAFRLSSLRGQRILLKFFRGHW
jgi:lysylphosphatidylglycerol synthetase-like protein (DUF2156 family)